MIKELTRCLACDSENLTKYMTLGIQPPANSYTDEPTELDAAPLDLVLCGNCSHSQLSVIVDPEILFSHYLYVSGTTRTRTEHFKSFAKDLSKRVEGRSVLEIGCNDGSCLREFQDLGWDVMGIDPASNLWKEQRENGVYVSTSFWEEGSSEGLEDEFNLIYGMNVFAHNPSPITFLLEAKKALKETGLIVLEFPYALNTFETVDIGQIYHEHISYFSVSSMMALSDRAGLGIADIVETPHLDGGAIRFYLSPGRDHCDKAIRMSRREKTLGMNDLAYYEKFQKNVMVNLMQVMQAFQMQTFMGAKVVAYGAAAKFSTMVNAIGERSVPFDYVIDDNPLKCGKYVPGTAIPIVPTSTLDSDPDMLCILIGAHNFKDEIMDRIRARRSKDMNDVCLHWVPKVEVEELYRIK